MRTAEGVAAVVLRRTEYGDSDLILSLYCRSLGKITAVARSARRSRKRFGAALGLLTLSEISISAKPKASMWTLLSAEPRHSFESLATDVFALGHASYGTELVRELCGDELPDPGIFDLLLDLYESLQEAGPKAGRLRVFELRLLQALGLAPFLARCVSCQQDDLASCCLDPDRGGVICDNCQVVAGASDQHDSGVRPLSLEALQILQEAQAAHSLIEGDALEARPGAVQARGAMLSLLYWHVGKPLKSVEFIAKLANQR